MTLRPLRRDVTPGTPLITGLLMCGVASSVLYSATEILASLRWDGYDWTSRMVSDLLAVSAPTRSFIVAPMLAYNALILAFGIGVWLCRKNRAQQVTAILLAVYAVAGVIGLLVFPLDYNTTGSGALMHMVATFTLIVLMFSFIVTAAVGGTKAFRIYSAVTVLVIIGGAVLAGMQVPRIEAGLPTPGLGIFERLNIYAMLVWVTLFAITLWQDQTSRQGNRHSGAASRHRTPGQARERPAFVKRALRATPSPERPPDTRSIRRPNPVIATSANAAAREVECSAPSPLQRGPSGRSIAKDNAEVSAPAGAALPHDRPGSPRAVANRAGL